MALPQDREEQQPATRRQSKDLVAIILALGVATAINLVTLAIMWDAVQIGAEISENGTQILTGVLGGAVGVLGSYLGYSAALTSKNPPTPPEMPPTPEMPSAPPALQPEPPPLPDAPVL